MQHPVASACPRHCQLMAARHPWRAKMTMAGDDNIDLIQ